MGKTIRLSFFVIFATYFISCAASPAEWHFIDGVNLIFHEAGHWLFWPMGEFLHVLGGSLNQILIPLLISFYFFWKKQPVSAFAILLWAGQSLINISVYAADAIKMQLPLLGGDSSTHDWNWLLIYLGQLRHTPQIAQVITVCGWLVLLAGLFGGIYFILIESKKVDYGQTNKS